MLRRNRKIKLRKNICYAKISIEIKKIFLLIIYNNVRSLLKSDYKRIAQALERSNIELI